MENKEWTLDELHHKIKQGLDLAFEKLVAEKKRNNEVFVFLKMAKLLKLKLKILINN